MLIAPNATTGTPVQNKKAENVRATKVRAGGGPALLAILVVLVGVATILFYHLRSRTTERTGRTPPVATAPKPESTASQARPDSGQKQPAPVRLTPGEISAKYSSAVVILDSFDDQGQKLGQGSGFVISPTGRILTNYHVIRGASRMEARTHDQSVHEVEYIAAFDMAHDVAVLKIDGEALPTVPLGESGSVKPGDHVTALGAPLGLENTLSDGIVSAIREAGNFGALQITAPISHGSSGGPLFDDYGNAVGLAVATVEAGENLNFAVPIDFAKRLLGSEGYTTFAELLSTTLVHQPILTSSLSIPPQVVGFDVSVPQQGGLLSGEFSISGGLGNDIGVSVASADGPLVWNGGVISNRGSLRIRLRGGRYKLVFNNKMGPFWVSSKTVSGTIELSYYR